MATLSSSPLHPGRLLLRDEAVASLLDLFRANQTFLVTSHTRPDGDAVGSALGMQHLLESLGKEVTAAFADPIPFAFQGLPGAARIQGRLPSRPVDVAVVMECDSVARTGFAQLPAALLVNIDHHASGTAFAAVNWIDPEVPAVGAMVYDLAVASGVPLSPALASCLYAAVLTDTVSFTLPNTTSATFRLASHLLASGADAAAISDAVYRSQPESKLRLLGTALRRLEVHGPVAWSALTGADMAASGSAVEDSEGIVQHLISVEGVRAAALVRELPERGLLRASLRSKGDVNVAEVAERFGGGGHRNASGCTVRGPLEIATRQLEVALLQACYRAPLAP